jgi:hypothetical protein
MNSLTLLITRLKTKMMMLMTTSLVRVMMRVMKMRRQRWKRRRRERGWRAAGHLHQSMRRRGRRAGAATLRWPQHCQGGRPP